MPIDPFKAAEQQQRKLLQRLDRLDGGLPTAINPFHAAAEQARLIQYRIERLEKRGLSAGEAGLITVNLFWAPSPMVRVDYDLHVALLDDGGVLRASPPYGYLYDWAYYGQDPLEQFVKSHLFHVAPKVLGDSSDNGTGTGQAPGDATPTSAGSGPAEMVRINTLIMPDYGAKLVIAVDTLEANPFGSIAQAYITIVNESTGIELANVDLKSDHPASMGALVAQFDRVSEFGWQFSLLNQSYDTFFRSHYPWTLL